MAIEERPLRSRGDCKRCFNERWPLVIAKRHGMSNQLYLDPPATDCAGADGHTVDVASIDPYLMESICVACSSTAL